MLSMVDHSTTAVKSHDMLDHWIIPNNIQQPQVGKDTVSAWKSCSDLWDGKPCSELWHTVLRDRT